MTIFFPVWWFPDYYVGCIIFVGILVIFGVSICQVTNDGFRNFSHNNAYFAFRKPFAILCWSRESKYHKPLNLYFLFVEREELVMIDDVKVKRIRDFPMHKCRVFSVVERWWILIWHFFYTRQFSNELENMTTQHWSVPNHHGQCNSKIPNTKCRLVGFSNVVHQNTAKCPHSVAHILCAIQHRASNIYGLVGTYEFRQTEK